MRTAREVFLRRCLHERKTMNGCGVLKPPAGRPNVASSAIRRGRPGVPWRSRSNRSVRWWSD